MALVVADRQIKVAQDAAIAERDTAFALQKAERDARNADERARDARLSHAFGRELIFASRDLKVMLANLNPGLYDDPGPGIVHTFVRDNPLPDLALIDRFADRLEGFDDADAFSITTALASWRSYNRAPGVSAEDFITHSPYARRRMVRNRTVAGYELLKSVEALINRLAEYYDKHPAMQGTVLEDTPEELLRLLKHLQPDAAPDPAGSAVG